MNNQWSIVISDLVMPGEVYALEKIKHVKPSFSGRSIFLPHCGLLPGRKAD
jgi:hypothetical protein